jgi:hypothetical protein
MVPVAVTVGVKVKVQVLPGSPQTVEEIVGVGVMVMVGVREGVKVGVLVEVWVKVAVEVGVNVIVGSTAPGTQTLEMYHPA